MIRKILLYGEPVLETPAAAVEESEFGSDELQTLVDDLFQTMYENKGVGLAAPQVGVSKRLFVVDCSVGENPAERMVLINPEIIAQEGRQTGEEGCLSIPGFREDVTRARVVRARARKADGEPFEICVEELPARAVLHENDHLDGILFLKYLSPLKRSLIKRKIKNLKKKGEWN